MCRSAGKFERATWTAQAHGLGFAAIATVDPGKSRWGTLFAVGNCKWPTLLMARSPKNRAGGGFVRAEAADS